MTYNEQGKRTSLENLAGQVTTTAWDCCLAYAYNNRSELTNAVAAGDSDYRYAYDFDDIGNRITSFDLGTNRTYTANNLNQYTQISSLCDSASLREEFTPQFDLDGNQTLIKTSTGRWQNADPIENYFSPNLYSMVNNDVMSRIDVLGLKIKVEKRDQEKLLPIFKELFGEVVFDGKGYLVIDKENNSIGCKCVNLIKEEPTYTISIDDDETALYGGGAFSPLDFHCGGHIYIGSKTEYDQGNEIEFAFSWPPIRTKRNIKSQLDILAHELGHAMTHQAKMKDADRKLPHGDRNKKRLEGEAKKFETLIRNRCHEK